MRENVVFLFTSEYIEDICPYATFQLNKQTYSESSYSGNIYSGPYHSVRGSFVYHDSKPDGYHVSCNSHTPRLCPINRKLTFFYFPERGAGVYESTSKRQPTERSAFREPR